MFTVTDRTVKPAARTRYATIDQAFDAARRLGSVRSDYDGRRTHMCYARDWTVVAHVTEPR